MAALRELLAHFGIEVDAKELEHFTNNTLTSAISGIQSFGATLATAFGFKELGGFIRDEIELGSKLQDTSEKLGIQTDLLQEWQYAGSLVGVEAETISHSLGLLQRKIGEANAGTSAAVKEFKDLHIETKNLDGSTRDTNDVIGDLAEKIKDAKSGSEKTAIAMKLFGRAGASMVPILGDGQKGLAALRQEFEDLGGGLSKDFVKAADDAGDNITRMEWATKGLKSQLALAFLPAVSKVVIQLAKWIAGLRKWLETTTLMRTALYALGVVGSMAFLKLVKTFGTLLGILKPGNLSLLGMLKSFGMFALYAAIIAGIVLLFDDLLALIEGNDSAIGDLFDAMGMGEQKAQFVADLKQIWTELGEIWTENKGTIGELGHDLLQIAVAVLPIFLKSFIVTLDQIANAVDGIISLVRTLWALMDPSTRGQAGKFLSDFSGRFQQRNDRDLQLLGLEAKPTSSLGIDARNAEGQTFVPYRDLNPYNANTIKGSDQKEVDVNQTNSINITIERAPGEDGSDVADHVGRTMKDWSKEEREVIWHRIEDG